MMRLSQVKAGNSVIFLSAAGGEGIVRKIMDMGLIPGEKIKILQNTGYGQVTICIKGSKLAIGHGLAQKIAVRQDS